MGSWILTQHGVGLEGYKALVRRQQAGVCLAQVWLWLHYWLQAGHCHFFFFLFYTLYAVTSSDAETSSWVLEYLHSPAQYGPSADGLLAAAAGAVTKPRGRLP